MADIFLSYASQDRNRARAFVDLLENRGWSVWWDREILPGTPFDRVIDQAIQNARCVVVLFTSHSVESSWVSAEALDGLERGILVPVRLEDVRVPVAFRGSQFAELFGWPTSTNEADLERMFSAINAIVASSRTSAPMPSPSKNVALSTSHQPADTFFSSFAVLPFENLTGDTDNDYLSEGLSDEIRSDLASIRGLRVVAGSSCYYFRERSRDVRVIGQMLDVRHVVEGRVRRIPNGFRLMVEVANTRDGYQEFSRSLDFTTDTISEAQASLVADLREIVEGDQPGVSQKHEPDPEAYHVYLQGLFHFNNADTISRQRAITFFKKAAQIDPDFADAWSGLSWAWSLRSVGSNDPLHPQKTLLEGGEAAERALALQPDSAVALGARGAVEILQHNWDQSEHYIRRALDLDPHLTPARYVFCAILTVHGQLQEAISYMERTLVHEPLSPIASNGLARLLRYAGRYEEAEEVCLRLLSAVPNSLAGIVGVTNASMLTGNVPVIEEHIASEQAMLGADSPTVLFHKARLAGIQGDGEAIQRLYQQMLQIHRTDYINSSVLAITALMTGDIDTCLDWIELGCKEKDVWLIDMPYLNFSDALTKHPRYLAVYDSMHFPIDQPIEMP